MSARDVRQALNKAGKKAASSIVKEAALAIAGEEERALAERLAEAVPTMGVTSALALLLYLGLWALVQEECDAAA